MKEVTARFEILASSTANNSDKLLVDDDGQVRIYIGTTGTISEKPVRPAVVRTLIEREHWSRPEAPEFVSESELTRLSSNVLEPSGLWRKIWSRLSVEH